jgi:tetratricopeptide (TPR) repeat protein
MGIKWIRFRLNTLNLEFFPLVHLRLPKILTPPKIFIFKPVDSLEKKLGIRIASFSMGNILMKIRPTYCYLNYSLGILLVLSSAVLFAQEAQTSRDLFLKGVKDLKTQKFKQARNEFQTVLQNDPDNVKAHYYLGVTAYYTHQNADAENELRWVESHEPEMPINHLYLGRLYYDTLRYLEAGPELDMANQLDPQISLVHYYRGLVYYKTGQIDQADREFSQSLQLDPSLAKAHYARAYLLTHDRQDTQTALQEIQAGLQAKPDKKLKQKFLKLQKTLQ